MVTEITKKEKSERLANRVFSPPEQENPKSEPHTTMDIYALGQVLQWFATSETLKGTGRKSINGFYENVAVYDSIIEICLKQDQKKRFQTVSEIENYFESIQEEEKDRDPFSILSRFNHVLRKTFPKKIYDPYITTEKSKIDSLFTSLRSEEGFFGNFLWFTKGYPNMYFTLNQNDNGNWCIGPMNI